LSEKTSNVSHRSGKGRQFERSTSKGKQKRKSLFSRFIKKEIISKTHFCVITKAHGSTKGATEENTTKRENKRGAGFLLSSLLKWLNVLFKHIKTRI